MINILAAINQIKSEMQSEFQVFILIDLLTFPQLQAPNPLLLAFSCKCPFLRGCPNFSSEMCRHHHQQSKSPNLASHHPGYHQQDIVSRVRRLLFSGFRRIHDSCIVLLWFRCGPLSQRNGGGVGYLLTAPTISLPSRYILHVFDKLAML